MVIKKKLILILLENFGDAPGHIPKLILTLCHNQKVLRLIMGVLVTYPKKRIDSWLRHHNCFVQKDVTNHYPLLSAPTVNDLSPLNYLFPTFGKWTFPTTNPGQNRKPFCKFVYRINPWAANMLLCQIFFAANCAKYILRLSCPATKMWPILDEKCPILTSDISYC